MFVFIKIITFLLLPPGIFVIALVVSILLSWKRKRTASIVLSSIVASLLYLFSIEPIRDALIRPLEDRYPPLIISEIDGTVIDKTTIDAIVVLGGGVVARSPEERGAGSLATDSLKRLIHGALLHEKFGLPIIVAGGNLFANDTEPWAVVASRTLKSLGIDEANIVVEEQSRNTWENAALVKALASPSAIILVTSAYHMPRSMLSFRRNGIICIAAPTDYKSERVGYGFISFLPTAGALEDVYMAFHEYIGYLYYSIVYREIAEDT